MKNVSELKFGEHIFYMGAVVHSAVPSERLTFKLSLLTQV